MYILCVINSLQYYNNKNKSTKVNYMLLIALTYGPVLFAMLAYISYLEVKDIQSNNGSKMSLTLSLLLAIAFISLFMNSFV